LSPPINISAVHALVILIRLRLLPTVFLAPYLRSSHSLVKIKALNCLAARGSGPGPVARGVLECLLVNDNEVESEACRAVAKMGSTTRSSLEDL
jgi:hypothetical protein